MPSSKSPKKGKKTARAAGAKGGKNKKNKSLKVLTVFLLTIAAVVVGGFGVYTALKNNLLDQPNYITSDPSFEEGSVPVETVHPDYTGEVVSNPAEINDWADELGEIAVQGDTDAISNILVLGVETDGRPGYVGRSDAVMLVSVNRTKGQESIKLISLLRDTYVTIKDRKSNKLNAAYAAGNYPLLVDTIERNFRLKIDNVVAFNFDAYKLAVTEMGGIDMELTAAEAKEIGVGSGAGTYHLNGDKALAYARIRKIGNDWGRTERQRKVMQELMEQAKGMNILKLYKVMERVLPEVHTNMSRSELSKYIDNAMTYLKYPVEEAYFPTTSDFDDKAVEGVGLTMILKDQPGLVKRLHHFIYG